MLRLMSAFGLCCMVGLAWLLSEKRAKPHWRILVWGMGLQFLLGIVVLRTEAGTMFFTWVKSGFDVITESSGAGADFLFGRLSTFFFVQEIAPGPGGAFVPKGPLAISAVMAFNVLPVIIFVSGLAAVLQHLGVIQAVVRAMAWLMRRTMRTSGAETFGAALLVFLGIESVSALGAYLKTMTRSEIFTIMTAFLATIAASVMVAYAGFGAQPGHLLAASLMSAPAAIVIAKLMVPETEIPKTAATGVRIEIPVETHNIFDAAARGAALGLNMALHVGALLICFVGFIHLLDLAVSGVTGTSLTVLMGWVFRPFAFVMGVPARDVPEVAELLATKSVFNEFLAYQNLQPLIQKGVLSKRAVTIATYALCGFANPGSLGIMIGAMAGMAPERRGEVAQLSVKAFIAGTLAAFTTACVAGILTYE